jgi:hypothetical protein
MGSGDAGAADLRWIFRPSPDREVTIRALDGLPVHSVKATGVDGFTDVVLSDGTHLRAARTEIVAE